MAKTSGGRGYAYETRTCMVLFTRGFVRDVKNFRLEYQEDAAGKFDDVIFHQSDEICQLIQLKHKENNVKTLKITSAQLFNEKYNGDFNLLKYVQAFKEANASAKFKDRMKYAVVFTNIHFDLKDHQLDLLKNARPWYNGLKSVQLNQTLLDHDTIFDFSDDWVDAKYYKFADDEHIVQILKRQAEAIALKLRQNKKLTKQDEAIADSIENLTEDEIRNALKYIIYAVGQPDDAQFAEIIKTDMKSKYKLQDVDDLYNKLETNMRTWCDTKTGQFPSIICYNDAEKFFQRDFKAISFDVRQPTMSFTGRIEELKKIREQLHKEQDLIVSQTVAISGLGGMGKTQLARQFIKTFGESEFYGRVIWISAENDAAVEESFKRLGEKLKLEQITQKHTKTIIDEVFDYFEGLKVLFVFDNFDRAPEKNKENFVTYCREYVSQPFRKCRPYFLFTSRDKNCLPNVSSLNLGALTKEEAVRLIENEFTKINYTPEQKDVEDLAEILQNFPLALQQAIAYIKEQRESVFTKRYKIQDYLKAFETKKQVLLDYKFADDFGSFGETTFITWNITFDAIQRNTVDCKTVIRILQFFAYIYAEGIDPNMLLSYFSGADALAKAFEMLERYSIITRIEETNLYQIHRLVQTVVQIKFQSKKKKILREAVRIIVPKVVETYTSIKYILNKFLGNNNVDYIKSIEECTAGQALHLNVLRNHFSDDEKLYKKYEKLFDDINEKGFTKAAFNDDVDKLKLLEKSGNFIKDFVRKNISRLMRSKCNKVIKYCLEKDYLNYNYNPYTCENLLLSVIFEHENIEIFLLVLPKIFMRENAFSLSEEFCNKFLAETTNVNLSSADGCTLLHIICKYPKISLDVVRLLIEGGVNIDATDEEEKTALYYSFKFNNVDVFKYLLTKSSSVDEDILRRAIERDNLSIAQELLEKHFSIDYRFKNSETPIDVAVAFASVRVVFFLKNEFIKFVKRGGDPNKTNDKGETLLIKCIRYKSEFSGRLNNIKFLVENGVNVDVRDKEGKTALLYSLICNHTDIFNYLLTISTLDENILKLATTLIYDTVKNFCN